MTSLQLIAKVGTVLTDAWMSALLCHFVLWGKVHNFIAFDPFDPPTSAHTVLRNISHDSSHDLYSSH